MIFNQFTRSSKHFFENGYTETGARKAFDYYNSNNWTDSKGKKVKSWKQKMIGVWFKPEYLKPISPPIKPKTDADYW